MTTQTQSIVNQSLSLSAEERAFVANALLQSLEENPFNYENEWAQVANNRSKEIKEGTVKTLTEEEFRSGIKLPNA